MYQLSPVPPGDSIGDKIGPLPRHGAITLDGNRRWGHSLGRHPGEGHVEAIEIIGWIARCMIYIGIKEMAVSDNFEPMLPTFGSSGKRSSLYYKLQRIGSFIGYFIRYLDNGRVKERELLLATAWAELHHRILSTSNAKKSRL
ncbi:uncharacterized protein LOC111261983 isoform X3 [Varroa jacobsoni]|nr:uncharacterized protein LOC111261983 isoform X3 [Varroa jacobsoni]XP_022691652.1 uncharacterized protein LOC111261983 isoform X3 [Varroa jacobsoni]XP_022691653.1 uncharacterized protein LOC111261983 isoform X3 [Varroa jacobsoni]